MLLGLKLHNRKGKRKFFYSSILILLLCFWIWTFVTNFSSSNKKNEFRETDSTRTSLEIDIELWLRNQQIYDKYIILEPQGGYGNAFNAISSSVLLAMLTDRALVIDWAVCALDQFGPPLHELCLNQRLMNDVNFATLYNKNNLRSKHEKLERTICLKVRCYAAKEYKNIAKKMQFGHFPQLVMNDFNVLWPFPLVTIKAENYFLGFLFLNKAYEKHLAKYHRSGEFFYPKILRILFKPVPRIQRAIDSFAKRELNGGKCISIFVRILGIKGSESLSENYHMFRSKRDANRLLGPQHFDCLKRYFSKELSDNTTVFVASLYKEVKKYFKDNHENVLFYSEDVGIEGSVLNHDLAVIDMYLLAHCSSAIYSYSSTFAQVARALAKKPQKMFQTLSPTLNDGISPVIDRIGETLYQVEGDCKEIKTREGCAAPWVRWRNRNILLGEGETFYTVAKINTTIPGSFDYGNVC